MRDAPFRPQAGIYLWAGPGTIRMIQLKEFQPRVDVDGLLRSYDPDVLAGYRHVLGITDVWATLSWGFDDETEQADWHFLQQKLPHFREQGLRVHAYVQGTNLVADQHRTDYWCRDPWNRTIPYHRGRWLACPHNPAFRQLLLNRITRACQSDVDGIYVDNFHMGQFAVPLGRHTSFMGCHCSHCQRAFWERTGFSLPTQWDLTDERVQVFLRFRAATMTELAQSIASITRSHGKLLGTNSFDATLDTRLTYGTDLMELSAAQDYLLLENYDHPASNRGNAGLRSLIQQSPVPVCVVSYRHAIGRHPASRQQDLNAVFSESQDLGYVPVYKGTEFTTDGRWHNLDPTRYQPVTRAAYTHRTHHGRTAALPLSRVIASMVSRCGTPFLRAVYERRWVRRTCGWVVVLLTTRRYPF